MRARRRRSGFTMLEAVVALAIVAMVCVGILGAYAGSLRADTVAVDRLPLAALAVERLARVDVEPGSLARLPDSTARGALTAPYDGVRWEIATREVSKVPGLVEVDVRVFDANDSFTLHTRRWRQPLTVARP
jgi:prepilin-type N-terminal cleavage/methylation domain-containing protein